MKMDPVYFGQLSSYIAKCIKQAGIEKCQSYAAAHGPVRMRWALFHHIPLDFSISLYHQGLNDDHIDTALRKIVEQHGLPV